MDDSSVEFTGWPADGPALLAEIAADNRSEAWGPRHETAVRAPMLALAAALAAEFGPVRVFRPRVNRRFRPDAPPLRTDTGGVARSAGGCTLAVVLTATALTVTAGHWRFDPAQLARFRAAVAGPGGGPACSDPGAALTAVLQGAAAAGLTPDPEGEMRGVPRGWAADHPRIGLVRRRGLQVTRSWEVGPWLATPEPVERVRAAWRAAAPVVAWLDEHVGPPAPAAPRPRPGREEAAAPSVGG